MNLICVGHAIKEVLSAQDSLAAIKLGAQQAGVKVSGSFLLSDGGDGFLEVYQSSHAVSHKIEPNIDALGASHLVPMLFDEENNTAVIETALCIGLAQVDPARRNIMISGSAGVADLIYTARNQGATKVIIGLGGTATCDGGVGLLWRLAELSGQCRNGCPEIRTALDMADIPSPDMIALQNWLNEIQIEVCVDVNIPLLGSQGAVRTFAPQKGASPIEVDQLEAFMGEWADRVERNAGNSWRDEPGAGAAGGLGFALAAISGKLVPGALASMSFTGLDSAILAGATVLTTEGRFDSSSFNGKAPWCLAEVAKQRGATVAVFCGVSNDEAVSRAESQGVDIVQYGQDTNTCDLKSESPEQLKIAVAEFLRSRRETSA